MKLFADQARKPIIVMLHVQALPGTPKHRHSMRAIIDHLLEETHTYQEHGVDAMLIENMHDVPYSRRVVGDEIISAMSVLAHELRRETDLPLGIQILAGANKAALAVAHAAGLDFIRAEGFVFAHVADEGIIQSDAAELLRYRKYLGAEEIDIFTDIKKKHSSHSLTQDICIGETASAAEFFLSDGVIVSGNSTGKACNIKDLDEVCKACKLPILIGSGITTVNLCEYWELADAFIVGSHFKVDGLWSNALSLQRIKAFMTEVERLRP
ncbi:MAG: BtpA/SgcQ family protein [Candidatus Cloacimonadaceae bacterium]|nr:BtpA/SgcQ family protein [Candidatus Cloacimonadaceae bacterium]MDP3113332.1 BtpA/SgcQ family protein [Candidatus Cloacimonadaceae bacterium]